MAAAAGRGKGPRARAGAGGGPIIPSVTTTPAVEVAVSAEEDGLLSHDGGGGEFTPDGLVNMYVKLASLRCCRSGFKDYTVAQIILSSLLNNSI